MEGETKWEMILVRYPEDNDRQETWTSTNEIDGNSIVERTISWLAMAPVEEKRAMAVARIGMECMVAVSIGCLVSRQDEGVIGE